MVKFNYSGIGNVKGGEKVVVVQFESPKSETISSVVQI